MDFENPKQRAAFFDLHSGNPREGPGNQESTARALTAVRRVVPEPQDLLDLGCGPGMQTRHLASLLPSCRITALDLHEPFVGEVQRWVDSEGLGERVRAVCGDMGAAPVAPASVDVVWCEAAAYSIGVVEALRAWRPLLRTPGCVAFSEIVFLEHELPATVREEWLAEYPAMTDLAGVEGWIAEAGYALVERFVLPAAAWWAYYEPLEARIQALREVYRDDPDALLVLDEGQREIDTYRQHGGGFGYAFFVVRPEDG